MQYSIIFHNMPSHILRITAALLCWLLGVTLKWPLMTAPSMMILKWKSYCLLTLHLIKTWSNTVDVETHSSNCTCVCNIYSTNRGVSSGGALKSSFSKIIFGEAHEVIRSHRTKSPNADRCNSDKFNWGEVFWGKCRGWQLMGRCLEDIERGHSLNSRIIFHIFAWFEMIWGWSTEVTTIFMKLAPGEDAVWEDDTEHNAQGLDGWNREQNL